MRDASPKNNPGGRRAFTLLEIVLALGLGSFALVGLLGLMAFGVDAATDVRRATMLALIARDVFGQLAGGDFRAARLAGPGGGAAGPMDLSQNGSLRVALDAGGEFLVADLGTGPGSLPPGTVWLAEIAWWPESERLARVDLLLGSPHGGARGARFVGWVGDRGFQGTTNTQP